VEEDGEVREEEAQLVEEAAHEATLAAPGTQPTTKGDSIRTYVIEFLDAA
jgi:hypothetical protein